MEDDKKNQAGIQYLMSINENLKSKKAGFKLHQAKMQPIPISS